MPKVVLADMTYKEVSHVLEGPHVALVPTGSTEQHGPHLPLDVDIRIAESLCRAAADAVEPEFGAIVVPAFPFGVSEHHMGFPGTITIKAETFVSVVYEIGESLIRHGFDRLILVNGHGGNEGALQIAAQKLRLDAGAACVVYLSEWTLAEKKFASIRDSQPGGTGHACEYETSLYLHLRADFVQVEKAVREMIPPVIEGALDDLFMPGPYHVAAGRDRSRSGVEGDATLADPDKGRELYESAVQELAQIVRAVARA